MESNLKRLQYSHYQLRELEFLYKISGQPFSKETFINIKNIITRGVRGAV